jgi:hypothetical protein
MIKIVLEMTRNVIKLLHIVTFFQQSILLNISFGAGTSEPELLIVTAPAPPK